MAGSDQSANLGGMLSQIGQTLGTPMNTTALTDNMRNTFRPGVDPNDPASLQNYARWAGSVGKADEARQYNSQAAELRTQQRQQAGGAALASIMQGMQTVASNKGMSDEVKRERLAALQLKANEIATQYGLPVMETANLAGKVTQQTQALETQALNIDVQRRTNQRQTALSMLGQAEQQGEEEYAAAVAKVNENGFGDVVRGYEAAKLEFAAAKQQYDDLVTESKPLSEKDYELARGVGMPEDMIKGFSELTPRAARAEIRRLGLAKAEKDRKQTTATKTLEYGVVKDLVPSVLRDLQREGSQWFNIFDKDVEDIASDILDNDDTVKGIAAKVKASGARTTEDVRKVILDEIRKLDSGLFQGENAVDEFLGTKTRMVNGKAVTITEVK